MFTEGPLLTFIIHCETVFLQDPRYRNMKLRWVAFFPTYFTDDLMSGCVDLEVISSWILVDFESGDVLSMSTRWGATSFFTYTFTIKSTKCR